MNSTSPPCRVRRALPHRPLRAPAAALLVAVALLTGCDREPAAWTAAKRGNTAESYAAYVKGHAEGPHAAEARQMMAEAQDWVRAKGANNIDSLESFLSLHPGTQREAEVLQLLAPLREARDWTKATAENTADAIDHFLSQYPQSAHVEEASRMLVPLREERAWDEVSRQPSTEAVENFVCQYPQSARMADAQGLLRALRWSRAKASGGGVNTAGRFMDGYMRFISAFEVTHELSCDLGTAKVRYTVDAGTAYLDMTPDGKRIDRNGVEAKVSGDIIVKGRDGSSTTTSIVGIIWAPTNNLLGSYLYSYDTGMGVVNTGRFAGMKTSPPVDNARAVCAFKIAEDGTLAVVP